VYWFGRRVGAWQVDRRLIGFLGHESGLYEELSARENLLFAARMFGKPRPAEDADKWLRECGLDAWKHQPVRRLSRGMRQRIAIAKALIHDPAIVLLDEPFNGLDAEGRGWLAQRLQELSKHGKAICLSSHGEEPRLDLILRVLWLRSGSLFETSLSEASVASTCLQKTA